MHVDTIAVRIGCRRHELTLPLYNPCFTHGVQRLQWHVVAQRGHHGTTPPIQNSVAIPTAYRLCGG
ncbi:hypothetical protein APS60_10925 [Cutibacterium acnes]|uniref:Uncharacterized protein n=1 Tax=Cutibacterium acnes TaxID=1747 RepID=A0AA44U2S6_CUTAC|nr:hypothetical protein APS59_11490 [Cutibacterium acnes]PGF30318.1 hypothetical protein B1B02_04425 [Cutibacterium acnes subsp. defendens]PGF31154.1 hypothetical protein B1B08_04415 [Cutibacterium acnes subsp. defendens]PGF41610.1 hypothetical protein B1B14_04375 [Cutibacterium acnes subsp. defendens]PGF42956.1 hypothetical protein B1B12_11490 [Cutibacterium acnes subsp. defendens]